MSCLRPRNLRTSSLIVEVNVRVQVMLLLLAAVEQSRIGDYGFCSAAVALCCKIS